MEKPFRIGTRGSPLALAQARLVADALRAAHGWNEHRIELVPITTTGDMIQDRPLYELGGKALWTKELDRALLEGRTDISVHSMKDVETVRPVELEIIAMLPRADVRDRLVGAQGIAALPPGARVGTSSPRRAAQLLCRRPDLAIVPFRGNVATRLAKLERGDADATLLAAAGLVRLGQDEVGSPIETDELLPAPAQGAVGIEIAATNGEARRLVEPIDHPVTHFCIAAERRLLAGLGGTCRSPVAALAVAEAELIRLSVEILTADGSEVEQAQIMFPAGDEAAPGDLARRLLERASPALRALFAR
ncbi:MAG: hydroxymethylbilane synthase [Alphaproteobacteria bacterium]|nr:hydroxymethylbilane synthase [Alphaproteobacteria bacterium]